MEPKTALPKPTPMNHHHNNLEGMNKVINISFRVTPNHLFSLTFTWAFHPYFESILKVPQLGHKLQKK
jgi:hypothetical protein